MESASNPYSTLTDESSPSAVDAAAGTESPSLHLPAVAIRPLLWAVVAAANLGVIRFERVVSDTHRTLVNKMVVQACWYNLVACTLKMPLSSARLMLPGGLWGPACRALQLANHAYSVQMCMIQNEITFLRYVFICHLGTIGGLNEDLVRTFLTSLNIVVGMAVCLWLAMMAPEDGGYGYCVGSDGESMINCSCWQKKRQSATCVIFLVVAVTVFDIAL